MFTHASWRLTCLSALVAAALPALPRLGAQRPPAPQAPARRAPAQPAISPAVGIGGHRRVAVAYGLRRRGDYTSIPLSDEGRRVAFSWDPGTDGSCKAYGAAGLMRMPTRLNITWVGDDALKVETDAGQQTRLLQFAARVPPGARSLQGFSVAEWEPIGGPGAGRGGRGGAAPPPTSLKVVTTNLLEGWLRSNGVAYSDATTLTEY